MIQKILADDRFVSDLGFLKTAHLFSFADYYDPSNVQFGTLRVFNDDELAAKSGFPNHPHSNMEIVTIVLDGELTHQDSMKNRGAIKAGEVQYMSAGHGVVHAEMNESTAPVHLYQIWFMPMAQDLAPTYAQKDFSALLRKNSLTALISRDQTDESLVMHANVTVYRGLLEEDEQITYTCEPGHGVFIYVTEGTLHVNEVKASKHVQLRITEDREIKIIASLDADFILIDVAL
ncbi:MAG: pirin family protein [Candidatus Magasanikbacteria bacterium]|nr:pirin family protein [Candidatus Magasanikbacteria bacterium]